MSEPACLPSPHAAVKTGQPQGVGKKKALYESFACLAVRTRLELATPCVTGMYSNQTELPDLYCFFIPELRLQNYNVFLFSPNFLKKKSII